MSAAPKPAPLAFWFRSPSVRRTFALSAVVLATGGLLLYKAPDSSALPGSSFAHAPLRADGKNAVAFGGPGAHGVLSLSHTKVMADQRTPVYAELRIAADPVERAGVRAPIALAVVLDTSGSMSGAKIEDAKRSVLRLVSDMRDEDQIAVVRYSDTSELLQPLARVGSVRASLTSKIRGLEAGGGTNIPSGLGHGLRALDEGTRKSVRRIVLVSDGLDSTRAQAEAFARSSFDSGITVSSLGIGLDFDEAYMGSVAQNGHGNFAFVREGSSLAQFLKQELEETSLTTVENARVRIELPRGMRFVSAAGADAVESDGVIELKLGALFAGDQRRVVVELTSDGPSDANIRAHASWSRIDGSAQAVDLPNLALGVTRDPSEVERGRDGAVLASAISVVASKRQLEANSAYAAGDVARATALSVQNEAELKDAMKAAPAPAATALSAQAGFYAEQKQTFLKHKPTSAEGRAAAKTGTVSDLDNLNRASSKF